MNKILLILADFIHAVHAFNVMSKRHILVKDLLFVWYIYIMCVIKYSCVKAVFYIIQVRKKHSDVLVGERAVSGLHMC